MLFKGRLRLPNDAGEGIPIDLTLEDVFLSLVSDGEDLGEWRIDTVEIRRLFSNQFSLLLDGEEMVYIADDALGFAYDGLTFVEEVTTRLSKKRFRKSKKKPKTKMVSEPATAPEEIGSEPEPEIAPPVVDPVEEPPQPVPFFPPAASIPDPGELEGVAPIEARPITLGEPPAQPAQPPPAQPQPPVAPAAHHEPQPNPWAVPERGENEPQPNPWAVDPAAGQPARPWSAEPAAHAPAQPPPWEPPAVVQPFTAEPRPAAPVTPDQAAGPPPAVNPAAPETYPADDDELVIEDVTAYGYATPVSMTPQPEVAERPPVPEQVDPGYVPVPTGQSPVTEPTRQSPAPEPTHQSPAEVHPLGASSAAPAPRPASETPPGDLPAAASSTPPAAPESEIIEFGAPGQSAPFTGPNGLAPAFETAPAPEPLVLPGPDEASSQRGGRHERRADSKAKQSRFGRKKSREPEEHDHRYESSKTVGGITRSICAICGHVSFAGEDVYQNW